MLQRILTHKHFTTIFIGIYILVLGLVSFPYTQQNLQFLSREDGYIENFTNIAYIFTILTLLFCTRRSTYKSFFYSSALFLLILLMRELDLNKAFTPHSMLGLRFYISRDVFLWQKLFYGGIYICIVVFLASYIYKNLPSLLQKKVYIRSVYAAIIALIFAIITDKFIHKLLRIVHGSDYIHNISRYVEESLELLIPLLILVATLQFIAGRSPHAHT